VPKGDDIFFEGVQGGQFGDGWFTHGLEVVMEKNKTSTKSNPLHWLRPGHDSQRVDTTACQHTSKSDLCRGKLPFCRGEQCFQPVPLAFRKEV
jgi:hypothetical protein